MMTRLFSLFLVAVLCVAPSCGAAQLTPQQRKLADAIVGKRIAAIQAEVANSQSRATLQSSIAKLARREKEWQGYGSAVSVGWTVLECRERHVPVPASINEKVVDDIIWQFQNPYGTTPLDRKRHQAECARALGLIGHPKGVPFIIQALAQEGKEHTSWMGLGDIADERLVPAIEKYLDFSDQQDAFPAIASLAQTSEKAIPVLHRFLEGNVLPLRVRAADALIQIGTPLCATVLKRHLSALQTDDEKLEKLKRKIESGLLRIQCRAVDKIYTPPVLPTEDEARLWHLTEVGIMTDYEWFSEQVSKQQSAIEPPEMRAQRVEAANALVKIGVAAVGVIQSRLANSFVDGDLTRGITDKDAERATDVLRRIGTAAIPSLIDALCDEQQYSRNRAAKVLRQITGQEFGSDYATWSRWFLSRQNRLTPPQQSAAPDCFRSFVTSAAGELNRYKSRKKDAQ